jgi:hypothetical protein
MGRAWWALGLIVAAGCAGGQDSTQTVVEDEGTGPLGTGWANPFPNVGLLDQGGKIALRDLPSTGGEPLPVERVAWRDGFSPAQVSVLRLDGVDDSGFPSFEDPVPGQGTVKVVDLTAGEFVPCMAELDSYPDAPERVTLVRPLRAVPVGHRVAVVVTRDAVDRPARFDALISDSPPPSLAEVAPHWRDLIDALGPYVPEAEIAVAWDFPVGDGTAPLKGALAALEPPAGRLTLTRVRNADDGDQVVPGTWRAAEGTFTSRNFLVDDRSLVLGPDGAPEPTGEVEAYLYVHLPQSVKDAPAGTVPVMIFGHGIFSDPSNYLDDLDTPDSSRMVALADELGVIVVATTWRGLTTNDRIVPIQVAGDFSYLPNLTDMLVQGPVNTRVLLELVKSGEILSDPVFQGASGQPLADPSRVVYHGISLGGIQGGVFAAQRPGIDGAVLHVGGSMWSTMLERSANWTEFEILMNISVPNPVDRQMFYAVSQLWWDTVDPIAYVPELSETDFLLQEAIGDEQVANLTTEALARSVGLPLLQPGVTSPWGLEGSAGPLAGRALVQFDPEVPLPPVENRPAPVTGAHDVPRRWEGTRAQAAGYLRAATEGEIVHHCGADPCSESNQGSLP